MDATFTAPGPGKWALDRSHYDGGTTPLVQELLAGAMTDAVRGVFDTLGVPAETVDCRWVHGFCYTRLRPLVRPDQPSTSAPPAAAVWLLSRLHPEFRRRNKLALENLETSPAPAVIDEWRSTIRPRLVEINRRLGAVDLDAASTDALGAHVTEVIEHCEFTFREHFRLHGYDLGPIGNLIMEAEPWGLSAGEVVAALAGASPSTTDPIDELAAIHAAVVSAGAVPAELGSLDDVRAASPEAARLLEAYLDRRGTVLYAGYDVESPTLGEAPEVVLATIVNTASPSGDHEAAAALVADELRARVPAGDRDRFDELLAEARDAMDLRDDNGPITIEWPTGLLRLAVLALGRRLVADGRLDGGAPDASTLVFELTVDEIRTASRGGSVPATAELADRRAARRAALDLDPPLALGDDEPSPDPSVLPEGLRRLIVMTETVLAELGMNANDVEIGATAAEAAGADGLRGTGIGMGSVTGIARVATTAEDALAGLEPGEILVTRMTSPAYNMVLTLVDGLVTTDGGPMSHAAVLSRELGIPAVIGAAAAIDHVRTGDRITVDADRGEIRLGD